MKSAVCGRPRRPCPARELVATLALVGALALGTAMPRPAAARIVEETVRVTVQTVDARGGGVRQPIVVTLFHDDATRAPRPVLVLNHGRSYEPAKNAGLGRVRYHVAASWLAGYGFLVAVPTRIGYGPSGGPDVEDTGPCRAKRYPPGYAAAADQTLAVIEALRRRAGVARDAAIVMGQSYGGTTAIAFAARNPPGIRAAINFAGGGGGNPITGRAILARPRR